MLKKSVSTAISMRVSNAHMVITFNQYNIFNFIIL